MHEAEESQDPEWRALRTQLQCLACGGSAANMTLLDTFQAATATLFQSLQDSNCSREQLEQQMAAVQRLADQQSQQRRMDWESANRQAHRFRAYINMHRAALDLVAAERHLTLAARCASRHGMSADLAMLDNG